jgi:DNA-binding CsgD family transcriptional regulator
VIVRKNSGFADRSKDSDAARIEADQEPAQPFDPTLRQARVYARTSQPYEGKIDTSAFDGSPDCIKIISPDGRLKWLNGTGREVLNVTQEKVAGTEWIRLLPQSVHEAGYEALKNANNGIAQRFVGISEAPSVGVVYWDNLLTPLLSSNGEIVEILCISRDVTSDYRQGRNAAPSPDTDPSTANASDLTKSELECLYWAGLGKTAWETAGITKRSQRTVEFHLANAIRKLKASNKIQAAAIAMKNGLI